MPSARLRGVFRSLRFRLTAWNTAVVLLTVGGALLGVREGLRHRLLGDMDQQLREDAEELAQAVMQSYPDLEPVFQQIDNKADAHRHLDLFIELLDAIDKPIRSSRAAPIAPPARPATSESACRSRRAAR